MKYFNRDILQELTEAITRNRTRSILTGFGVFWGIFMLLILMGGGKGVKDEITMQFDGFATNSGFIGAMQTSKPYKGFKSGRSWELETKDIEKLKQNIPEVKAVSPMVSVWSSKAVFGLNEASCHAKGVRPDYTEIEAPKIKYGRYLNEIDVLQERKVCVIGKSVYTNLFEEGEDPCGKFIQIDGISYMVVGVDYAQGGISINGNSSESVTIPITVIQKIYNRGEDIDILCLTAKDGFKIKDILEKAKTILARNHYFDPDDKKAIMTLNLELLFGIMDNLFKGVNLLIWIVGFGTILAAVIGVSNIMMVSVKERTTEIGIRRAIGATPGVIITQIMEESVLLTLVSGMIGIIVSVGILSIVDMTSSDGSFQVSFGSAMVVLSILLVLGVLAGLAPAKRAMEIKPVDAMREE